VTELSCWRRSQGTEGARCADVQAHRRSAGSIGGYSPARWDASWPCTCCTHPSTTLIAHRQVVPDSAEQIAAIAGTHGTWVHTQRTDHRLNGAYGGQDTGTRTRGREFAIHPDEIKQLRTGWALVACPGRTQPRISHMLHPENAR
jgi:hypothetical protein